MLEQQKKQVNWTLIGGAGIFIVILFVGAYYLFFKSPELLVDFSISGEDKNIQDLSKIDFKKDADTVVGKFDKIYTNNFSSTITPPTLGRQNPFQPI